IRPRKNPSKTMTPTKATRLRMLGAASRSSVGRIGASSRSLVRAATGLATGGFVAAAGLAASDGENAEGELAMVWSVIGAPPLAGLEQRLRPKRLQEPGGCGKARLRLIV